MFAVIKTGGKQYKVTPGDKIWVEKLEINEGDSVSISEVLMLNDGKELKVGAPTVETAEVKFTVVEQTRDKKIIVFKKKRRQNYRRKQGHRQHKTVLQVESFMLGGKAIAGSDKKATAPKKAEPKATANATPKTESKAKEAKPSAKKKAPAAKAKKETK